MGRGARISAGVHLETQGSGVIVIGDGVVLSAGVHIVAFDRVEVCNDALIGEYSSIRDANHRLRTERTRYSGHDSAPISIGRNVWLGRGVTVLKGASIGAHSCVGANAVVNRALPERSMATGVPARAHKRLEAGTLPQPPVKAQSSMQFSAQVRPAARELAPQI
jgi:acetyltransferase-like isoleucine patch superfamily enzyme